MAAMEERVREVMGMDIGSSAQERKRREADKKRAYGDELQAQMRAAQERKQREREERFGRAPAPAPLPAPGPAFDSWSPGGMAAEPDVSVQHASMLNAPGAYESPQANMAARHQQQQPAQFHPQNAYDEGPAYGQQWGSMPQAPAQQYGTQPGTQFSAPAPYQGAQGPVFGSPNGAWGPTPGEPAGQGVPYGSPGAKRPEPWGSAASGSPPAVSYGYMPPQQQQHQPALQQGYMAAAPQAAQYGLQQGSSWAAGGQRQPVGAAGSPGFYSSAAAGSNGYAPAPFHQQQQPQQQHQGAAAVVAGRRAAQQRHGELDDAVAAANARKAAYRAELEAQMRDKAERKQQEKVRQQQEDMRKEQESASYNPWGRAGAGAPVRDGQGRVVSDLKQMCGMRGQNGSDGGQAADQGGAAMYQQQQQQQQGLQQQHGGAYGAGAGFGGAANGFGYPPLQQHQQHGPGKWDGGQPGSIAADNEAAYASPPHQQQQQQAGPGPGSAAAAVGQPPILNFRSDKAYQTASELERRAKAQQELQDALAAQIEDKRRRKEAEERKAKEDEEREAARLAREQALLAAQFEAEQVKQRAAREKAEEAEGKVAEAWSSATTAAQRRRALAAGGDDEPKTPGRLHQRQHSVTPVPALESQPPMPPAAPAIDERAVEERARQAAAAEMSRLREEMAREAAELREAMAAQQNEVLALRAKAASAEQQSSAAAGQLEEMRRDLVRRSQEAAHETLATILADPSYGPSSSGNPARIVAAYHPAAIRETTLNLELPAPAPVLRRALQNPAARGLEAPSSNGNHDPFQALRMHSGAPPGAGHLSMGGAVHGGGHMGGGIAGPSGRTRSVPVGVGESLLVSDSTFIFPSGFQPAAAEGAGVAGPVDDGAGADEGAWEAQRSAAAAGPSERVQQHQQRGQPGALQPSSSYGRTGLSTPLDVAGVYSRNEDKLRFLKSVSRVGGDSMEALDQFLATFANSTPQMKERRTYTPPTGLTGLGGSSMHDRPPIAARRGSSAHAPAMPPMRDTLDTEMQRLEGLLREARPPAAASAAALLAASHRVEGSEPSMASSSHWVKSALH